MNMNTVVILLSLIILLQWEGECARILVFFCQPARSHHIVFHPVLRKLAERGHEIDYYTHFPVPNPPVNLNQIIFANKLEETMKAFDQMNATFGTDPMVSTTNFMRNVRHVDRSMNCALFPELQELLSSKKNYDLVIGEFHFVQEHFSVLVHRFNALGVAFSSVPDSLWVNEMAGFPDNPSYMIHFLSDLSDKLNFVERVWNVCNTVAIKAIEYYYLVGPFQALADDLFKYEGWESRPPVIRTASDLALILVNSHHSLSYSYPKAPHVKEIMGTNVEETPKPLPKDLQDFMDSAEHGVIYFSFGSMLSVKQLRSSGLYDILVKVFQKIKQKVLWKWTAWSGEEIPNLPNIKMMEWLPQQSILAHNKTRIFITHGGLGGISEAVNHGVPLLGFPFFGDQFRNVRLMSEAGFGMAMSLSSVTEESLSRAIGHLVYNPRYKAAAVRRSKLFKDRPMKPVDEAVYWIEYVYKHGKVLQPASSTMPFYQLYLIDVFTFIIVSLLVLWLIVKKIACILISLLKNRNVKPTRLNTRFHNKKNE